MNKEHNIHSRNQEDTFSRPISSPEENKTCPTAFRCSLAVSGLRGRGGPGTGRVPKQQPSRHSNQDDQLAN